MKRNPTLPQVVRCAGIALVVVFAFLLVARVRASSQQDALHREFAEKLGPLDPAAYASPAIPDEGNAALWLRAAAAALVLSEDDKSFIGDLSTSEEAEWTPEQREALRGLLVRNAPALELIHRAGSMKQSSFGLTGGEKELKAKLPLLELLHFQRLLYSEARQALASKEPQESFWQATAAMAVNAASMEREAPLISQLVGVAAEKILLEVVWEAVRSSALDQAALARMEEMLPDVDLRATLRRSLASETSGAWAPESERIMAKQGAGITDEARLRVIIDVAATIDQPFGVSGRDLVAAVSVPATPQDLRATLTRAVGRAQSLMSLRRLARLSLALHRQALETGAYPASITNFPVAMGRDPFTGTMLEYERRADGSAKLTVPGAPELATALMKPIKSWVHFTWELPAPSRKR